MTDTDEAAEAWIEDALSSSSPSQRLKAAAWIKTNPEVVDTQILMRAMQRETVPQIRQLFNDVLLARDSLASPRSVTPAYAGGSDHGNVPELARLIRHELSPPIGWIRKAAGAEVGEYPRSRTNDAINRLERRLDALVALIRKESDLELSECDLERALREFWPDMTAEATFSVAPDLGGRPASLTTDIGLLEILLANVYQNAIDAALESGDDRRIEVSWSVVGERFWVRVSNPFSGAQFDVQDVETTGISTKSGHQGIGMSLIKTAAEKLGYGFRIAGRSGLATFTLTGGIR